MAHRSVRIRAFLVLLFSLLALPHALWAGSLPAGWTTRDVGAVAAAGSASYGGDVYNVKGSGADIWGAADEFRFVYRPLTGDGEIVARVDSLQAADAWTKAGVMMRESLAAGARHAFMLASGSKGFAFQYRTGAGGNTANVGGGSGSAPVYVRLARSGGTFTAARSHDGLAWTTVGRVSISMPATIYVGMAVTSHADSKIAAAAFSHVAVSTPLGSGWKTADVGPVGATGSASGSASSMTLKGAGADIWDGTDSFRFAYRMLSGDGEIVTRVSSIQYVDGWTKAGVMMRESLASGSRHALMLVSAGKGYAFQRRTAFNGLSASTSGGSGSAPGYVRLVRRGSTFTAYRSSDGASWTTVGSTSMSMASTIYVGIAVTSHAHATLASVGFASTAVTGLSDSSSSGSGTTSTSTSTTTQYSTSSTTTTATLRLVHWNLHHGVGTDGKYDLDRIATWIARMNPDVVSLNEVEKYTYWGNEDQPARYKAMLEAKTGRTWYSVWAQEYGQWSSNGKGNLLLSRFPLSSTARYELSYERTVALGQVVVNGRNITIATTHLDPDSGSRRLTQTKELLGWFDNFAEARIVAGDMNAQPTSTEMNLTKQTHVDAWAAAKSGGYAYSAGDNPYGYTRNSRIDYVFMSKAAGVLTPKRVEVVDTRDGSGVMPSDHRPILMVVGVN